MGDCRHCCRDHSGRRLCLLPDLAWDRRNAPLVRRAGEGPSRSARSRPASSQGGHGRRTSPSRGGDDGPSGTDCARSGCRRRLVRGLSGLPRHFRPGDRARVFQRKQQVDAETARFRHKSSARLHYFLPSGSIATGLPETIRPSVSQPCGQAGRAIPGVCLRQSLRLPWPPSVPTRVPVPAPSSTEAGDCRLAMT